QDISSVCFPEKPQLLPPRLVPNRKLTQAGGVAAFFHAIAHIEFMAIYLAWDILYRFRGLPEGFYQDWLTVADEEAQHFELICEHLKNLGLEYGDLSAHGGLWDHAQQTAGDVVARLALVPRCMEARGLDVTPGIIKKFQDMGDAASVGILTRILTDEVGHVERGSYWFKWCCETRELSPESHYQQMLKQYYQGGRPKGPFNREITMNTKNIFAYPLFALGFRAFFVLAGFSALLLIVLWNAIFKGELVHANYFAANLWHAHEMLLGYSVAVVAGFLLTAVKNWTGRPTLSGNQLGGLCLLWLYGRILPFYAGLLPDGLIAFIDFAFLPWLAFQVCLPIVQAKQ
ncbi:MAG: hypothetical protein FD128_2907, partial [Hyphomonadaceae bacterium]